MNFIYFQEYIKKFILTKNQSKAKIYFGVLVKILDEPLNDLAMQCLISLRPKGLFYLDYIDLNNYSNSSLKEDKEF
jgi:hypothetical protein